MNQPTIIGAVQLENLAFWTFIDSTYDFISPNQQTTSAAQVAQQHIG
jgi:hypothetical protein